MTNEQKFAGDEIIDVEIGGMGELEKSSIKYFLETGTINGNFRMRLRSIFSAGFRAQHDETIDSNTDKEWADTLKKALRRLVNAVDINPELAKEVQPANEAAKKLLTEYYNYKENTSI